MKMIVQNLATEYQDEGTGRVLLFLHGWQDSLSSFDVIASLLSKTYRVIRLDLPGFGGTEAPKETWDLDNYIQFVNDFISKLHVDVEVLVGHSFGGRIAIKGIATKKLHAKKLILIGSAGITKQRTLYSTALHAIAKIGGMIMYIPPFIFWKNLLRKHLYTAIGSDYLNAGPLQKTFLKIIAEDLGDDAKQITVPTLLIWGSDDTQTPLADGKRLTAMIHNSKLEIIKDAGHFVHKEKPQEVADFIQKFI